MTLNAKHMSSHIENAEKCLQDNNARGMSSSQEPYHWNLHNAVSALIEAVKEVEEDNKKLHKKVSDLEDQLRRK